MPLSPRLAAALSYGFALLLGAGLALALFPTEMLVPRAGGGFAPQGDAAQLGFALR